MRDTRKHVDAKWKLAVAAVHRGEDLLCMNIQKQKAGVDTLFASGSRRGWLYGTTDGLDR